MEEARSWASHLKGYFQPGILALTAESRVLYRWRCRPTRENIGGAIMRPTPEYTWNEIKPRLDQDATGQLEDAPLDDDPQYDAKSVPWPLFMLLLLAHGWFLDAKVFPVGRKDDKKTRPDQMWPRIAIFAAILIGAFTLLPPLLATVGLAGWGIFIWPKIAKINREFQNVPTGDLL
jgi:hypothetical protein